MNYSPFRREPLPIIDDGDVALRRYRIALMLLPAMALHDLSARLFRLALLLMVLVQVASAVTSRFVLCFGADGHVAVELPGHDHATSSGPDAAHADDGCIDVPWAVDLIHDGRIPHSEHVIPAAACSTPLVVTLMPGSASANRHPPGAPPPTSLPDSRMRQRRSVVLLI